MQQAQLFNISKSFAGVEAVRDVSMEVNAGEILALVGPSGCGKTTLLQIMAGLLKPDQGSFRLAGRTLSSARQSLLVPPEKRGIAMVFQNYALWPHYNVFGNIAYPLRRQGCSRYRQKKVVDELLAIVQLQGMEYRYPYQLSGGEQQRVALARALALNPALLLLDESLSNLDAGLRKEMQEEIKRIQRELSLTVIHVTHDQQEAMSIADRIAVMNQGRLVQIGEVEEVYRFPRTEFVAGFIGEANLIRPCSSDPAETQLWEMAVQRLANGCRENTAMPTGILAVRSEDISLLEDGPLKGRIVERLYHGSAIDYRLKFNERLIKIRTAADAVWEPGQMAAFTIERAVGVQNDG